MSGKFVLALGLVFVLFGVLGLAFNVHDVKAPYPTIYIRANGSIDPPTANITSLDNVTYTFTDNISASIVVERSNVTIYGAGFTLQGTGAAYGFNLTNVGNVTIKNVEIKAFEQGISLDTSSNNTISENNITGNSVYGMYLLYSHNNTILRNTFSSSQHCISLMSSHRNTILKNMDFSDSGYGVVLWGSDDCIVSENILSLLYDGIGMGYSDASRILNNTISSATNGIVMETICTNSLIANNIITGNTGFGIGIESMVEETGYNVILDNNITHNHMGIRIIKVSGNVINHNNFIDNTNQLMISSSTNNWDDGVEGNYWSNYAGVDLNRDGIGDMNHTINADNVDMYPLMGPFHSYNTSLGKSVYVISNSTVGSFQYESPSTIRFHVSNTTANQTHGFCRVSIPYEVLSEPFNVTIDGANPTYWNYTLYDNGTHRWIYFEYEHSTKEVVIIPEFPSLFILPLLMAATLLAALACRREHNLKT